MHAALSAEIHFFFKDDLKWPIPVHRRFSKVHRWRGRSSPLTPPPRLVGAIGSGRLPGLLSGCHQPGTSR